MKTDRLEHTSDCIRSESAPLLERGAICASAKSEVRSAAEAPGEVRTDALHGQLVRELSAAGCFRPATAWTIVHALAIIVTYSAAYLILLTDPGPGVRLLAIAALSAVCLQAGFVGHEAGHGAVTRHQPLARWIGQVFQTLLTAVCYSYFQHIHRAHHPHCNERSRDPDMQSSIFSLYSESASSKKGFGKIVSRHQAYLIWILVCLQGFSLKVDSFNFLRRNVRATRSDQTMLLLHLGLWLVLPALVLGFWNALFNYALMTLLCGPYLGAIFLVNHIGTRVVEPGETVTFFMQELSTTRNLGDSPLHSFLFGGLNNHIEHHLFPSMPTARLRTARQITRAFCRRHGLSYRELSWFAAAREVFAHFKAISALVPR